AVHLERRLLENRIRQVADLTAAAGAAHVGEQLRDHRIERRRLAVIRRELQQVHRRRAVGVGARGRRRRQDDAVAGDLARRTRVLVGEEEEALVVAVPETRDDDRAAGVETGL